MEIPDALELIEAAIPKKSTGSVWADLGCGNGTFTKALALLLGSGSVVYAIDEKRFDIKSNASEVEVKFVQGNFLNELPVPKFDGILMANSLHFVEEKFAFLKKLKSHINPGGSIVIVEYDREKPNQWVPYPIRFADLSRITSGIGFTDTKKIGERNSMFGPEKMYACKLTVD